jgi:hypothetical protein
MSLLGELSRFKSIAVVAAGVFTAGGSAFTWAALNNVPSRADLKAAIDEHAAHPHQLTQEEREALEFERRAHEDELKERGSLKAKVESMGEQIDRLVDELLDNPRRHR